MAKKTPPPPPQDTTPVEQKARAARLREAIEKRKTDPTPHTPHELAERAATRGRTPRL